MYITFPNLAVCKPQPAAAGPGDEVAKAAQLDRCRGTLRECCTRRTMWLALTAGSLTAGAGYLR